MSLPNIDSLPLTAQIAQMVVVRASTHLFDHQIQFPEFGERPRDLLKHWIADVGVGGVIFWGGNGPELSLRIRQLQSWAKQPLLIAGDIEEGVGQRFSGATWFPPPMALSEIAKTDLPKALAYAREMGATTAKEALAIGVNWILAPVVDVNNNPANPVINIRSFGENPTIVSQLAAAYIQGAADYPVLTCAKHFPGHGDTGMDSHWALPTIDNDLERLERIELPPFQTAIAAGVDSVMTAHLLIPALDGDLPATLSSKILSGLLRDRLGFDRLIATDALVMKAIADRYGADRSPVMSVAAGADIILMPVDPEAAITSVSAAVASGEISADRIKESVARIWQAKEKLARPNPQPIDLTELSAPASLDSAARMLTDALTCQGQLPIAPESKHNIIVVEEILDSPILNRSAPAITIPAASGHQLHLINRHNPNYQLPTTDRAIVQLFIRTSPFSGGLGIVGTAKQIVTELADRNRLAGLVIYGSPYLMADLRSSLPADLPIVFCYGQMSAAQSIALNKLLGDRS
jgi:beta-glucosidase